MNQLSGFDVSALARWLKAHVANLAGAARLTRIEGGQSNPTFFVDFDNAALVLRKQPAGELLPSAHAIDREFRVQRALVGADVPVPKMIAFCDDKSVIGTPFYVMEKLPGRVLPRCSLSEIAPDLRRRYFDEMAMTLARLHNVDWAAQGLADYGKPGNYFERQIARWTRQWQASKRAESADIDQLIAWLPKHVPQDDQTSIAHGDFRMGNLMWHATEPRVIGVLDWELSTLGHPMADLAYCCMAWHMSPHEFDGLAGLDLVAAGIPAQAEFVAAYQRYANHARELKPFHLAFSMFRFAVILAGVEARGRNGNAASRDASAVGAQAIAFARRGAEITRAG